MKPIYWDHLYVSTALSACRNRAISTQTHTVYQAKSHLRDVKASFARAVVFACHSDCADCITDLCRCLEFANMP